MAKQADFDKFLSNIEPSDTTVSYISSVQINLRSYLRSHEKYKHIHIDTFLSGSYAKHTSIRPVLHDKKRDVDIVVVTNYTSSKDSADVLQELCDVLAENKTYETARVQSHSVGIELNGINIDVVPVIADEEDDTLYYIGDSENGDWSITDPKGHKSWSTQVNQDNSGKYKPLVKIFKWWRRTNCPENRKYPKGITLEKIVADNLGDSSLKTEDFLITAMQSIVDSYKSNFVDNGENPVIDDPSEKIEGNDLLSGYSTDDFSAFVNKIDSHIKLLNDKGTTNAVWREILGTEFPSEEAKSQYSFTQESNCLSVSHRKPMPWPYQRGSAVFISLRVTDSHGNVIDYESNGSPLPKGCSLRFRALTSVKHPYFIKWQVVNTGAEARAASCLRGEFYPSDEGWNVRKESTSYTGTHSVQCFVIKRDVCVAMSKPFIINIK